MSSRITIVSTPDGPGRLIACRTDGTVQVALMAIPDTLQKELQNSGIVSNVKIYRSEEIRLVKQVVQQPATVY